ATAAAPSARWRSSDGLTTPNAVSRARLDRVDPGADEVDGVFVDDGARERRHTPLAEGRHAQPDGRELGVAGRQVRRVLDALCPLGGHGIAETGVRERGVVSEIDAVELAVGPVAEGA